TLSADRCSGNYCATSRRGSTIIAPISAYHHGSYAERYSRFMHGCGIGQGHFIQFSGVIGDESPLKVNGHLPLLNIPFSQKIETPYGTGTWRENFATYHRVETSWRLAQWPVTLSRGTDQSSILSAGIPAKSCRLRVTRVASRLRAMAAIRRSNVPIRI